MATLLRRVRLAVPHPPPRFDLCLPVLMQVQKRPRVVSWWMMRRTQTPTLLKRVEAVAVGAALSSTPSNVSDTIQATRRKRTNPYQRHLTCK